MRERDAKKTLAPCMDCGAAPGTYCSSACIQDAKKPGHRKWKMQTKPKTKYIVEAFDVTMGEWVIIGEYHRLKGATEGIEGSPYSGHRSRITQSITKTWSFKGDST